MNKILLRLLLATVLFIVILVANLALFNLTAGKVSVTESYTEQSEVFIRNVNGAIEDALDKGHILTKRKNDPFTNPDLDRILTENHVGTLMLVGLDAAQCVTSTVQAALNRAYEISVVESAVICKTEIEKKDALDEFSKLGVEIISF